MNSVTKDKWHHRDQNITVGIFKCCTVGYTGRTRQACRKLHAGLIRSPQKKKVWLIRKHIIAHIGLSSGRGSSVGVVTGKKCYYIPAKVW